MVMALQTIVSRNVDPLQMAVVTVGALHAGQANNVIPARPRWSSACARSTARCARCWSSASRRWPQSQAESFGVRADMDWQPGYPCW
jgi:hippurate hydrolase